MGVLGACTRAPLRNVRKKKKKKKQLLHHKDEQRDDCVFVLVRKSLEFDPPTLKTIPMKLKKKKQKNKQRSTPMEKERRCRGRGNKGPVLGKHHHVTLAARERETKIHKRLIITKHKLAICIYEEALGKLQV